MSINEAIKKALTSNTYSEEGFEAAKRHLTRPELLRDAAIECFLHEQEPEVEDTIRAGMIFLRQIGEIPKD